MDGIFLCCVDPEPEPDPYGIGRGFKEIGLSRFSKAKPAKV